MFMLLLDPSKESPAGSYTISNDISKEGALMGYPCAYTYQFMGSWWIHLDETWAEDGYAPLVSGSVTIAVDGGIASVVIDAVDDLGHKVTGSYNNITYMLDDGSWSLKKLSTGVKFANHAKRQLAPHTKAKISSLIKK
jgi:hypothetical protein